MPALNNTPVVSDQYTDALTMEFGYARPAFSVQVHNNAVYYQVGVIGPAGTSTVWESAEHHTVQALLSFRDPVAEGFTPGSRYSAIRFRRASTSGEQPRVSVA